jgi:molybdopterin converting factor small subunit
MIRETAGESALELAAKRLERAVSALEQRLQARASERGDLFDRGEPGGDLAVELERARERERELEAAGAEASAALGRAISEIRAALNGAGAVGG